MLIRHDFHPLCNQHYSEMVEGGVVVRVLGIASEAEIPVWRCTWQGCARHYDFNVGYHDLTPHGWIQGKRDSFYVCKEHEVKLYLKSCHGPSSTEVWQCPTMNCPRVETAHVAA